MLFVDAASNFNFINPRNAGEIIRYRQRLHELAHLARDILGIRSGNFEFHNGMNPADMPNLDGEFPFDNVDGICALVHVEGTGTFRREEYIKGVVRAEMGAEWDKPEALKAQAIAARSYLVARRMNHDSCTVPNSTRFQAFRQIDPNSPQGRAITAAVEETAGMIIMRNGQPALGQYMSYPNARHQYEANGRWIIHLQRFSNDPSTAWTWTGPPRETVRNANNWRGSPANSTTHNWGMVQVVAGWMASQGYTHMQILQLFYGTPTTTIGVMNENSSSGTGGPSEGGFWGEIRHFYQADFSEHFFSPNTNLQQFRGANGNPATIASHGSGPTALATVLSTLSGTDISPVRVTRELCTLGGCSSNGSDFAAMGRLATNYGYRAAWGNMDQALTALSAGNSLVIAMMGPGTFARGESFIVLTGFDDNNLISVSDPASRANTARDGFPINMIVDQRVRNRDFLIISRT